MVKVNSNPVTPLAVISADVSISVKPLKLLRSADELDAMSKMEWRFEVMKARSTVGRALNAFFYGGNL